MSKDKLALLFINPYYGESYELGKAVENDGELFADRLTQLGYRVERFIDCSAREFINSILRESKRSHEMLLIYYSGHGASLHDWSGDEQDGRDEAFVFRDGYVVDDEAERLVKDNNCEQVILISDCCHSGTIWDDAVTGNVCSISACSDNETAKQTTFHSKRSISHGVLTYYFWKYYDCCKGNLQSLIATINPIMKRYNQRAIMRGAPHSL